MTVVNMSVDKDFVFEALLRHNYLPTQRKAGEELPPIFTTKRLSTEVALQLARLKIRNKSGYPGYDQIEYRMTRFNYVSRPLSIPHPLPYVMKFAMKTLTKKPLDSSAKCAVFNYGLGLAFHHPLLLPFLDRSLADCKLLHDVTKKLNMIVREHARLHRSDGMTWGLYLLVKYHATIEECTADVIIGTADTMSIAVLYWSGQHLDKVKTFVKDLVGKDLYKLDAYWLLLYEVFRKEDISNPYRNSDCEVFQVLKERGVYFLADENTILDDDQNDTFSNLVKVLQCGS